MIVLGVFGLFTFLGRDVDEPKIDKHEKSDEESETRD
jgi:hypothetical protein